MDGSTVSGTSTSISMGTNQETLIPSDSILPESSGSDCDKILYTSRGTTSATPITHRRTPRSEEFFSPYCQNNVPNRVMGCQNSDTYYHCDPGYLEPQRIHQQPHSMATFGQDNLVLSEERVKANLCLHDEIDQGFSSCNNDELIQQQHSWNSGDLTTLAATVYATSAAHGNVS